MGSTHVNDLTIKQHTVAAAAYNNKNTILYIRPLNIPNPNPNPLHNPSTATFYSTTSPHNTFSLNTDHVSIRHADDDGDRKAECMEQPMSSRWNPTPEQLLALEEMYRRGVRTPTADHIQHIATELRRFGKIEGKNVFYWFQNHKARERQKRRRELTDLGNGNGNGNSKQREHLTEENPEKKESGLRKTGYDVEHTKNFWIPSSDCNKLSEETNTSSETGPQDNEWTKFDEKTKEFQQGKSTLINPPVATKDATWHPLELLPSYCPCSTPNLILNNNSLMAENYRSETDQTLELFPLRCNEDDNNNNYPNITAINPTVRNNTIFEDNTNSFTPTQYFEFLPLKN